MKNFQLTLSFDGQYLDVDYNDGSDTESYPCRTEAEIMDAVREAVKTALSPEDD